MPRLKTFWILLLLFVAPLRAADFDHGHAAWTALLQKHVVEQRNGTTTAVRYAAFAKDRVTLKAYLVTLSAVPRADYARWTKDQQLAFLINAYNAFTVELILTQYPDLESIRDLGSLLSSPWKKKFVPLLGATVSLDDIEHGMIRAKGVFDDPRIHAAVNCASIGCPALRREAFLADKLDAQLDDSLKRFLSDRTRNRYAEGRLEVSSIFDWYGEDFEQGYRGYDSLEVLFAQNAEQLADGAAARAAVREGRYQLRFLDYDWKLNDAR